MKRFSLFALVFGALALVPGVAGAGVGGPAFYVDGVVYRTVGTPTDLTGTGAPANTFDIIYEFDGAQELNVAESAPGDTDYNGGRWQVHLLSFDDYDAALAVHDANLSGSFDSDAEVAAALADAGATGAVDEGVVKSFVCPVIKLV
jgi:hypothetical protein